MSFWTGFEKRAAVYGPFKAPSFAQRAGQTLRSAKSHGKAALIGAGLTYGGMKLTEGARQASQGSFTPIQQ